MKNSISCFQKQDLVLIPAVLLAILGLFGWKTGNLIFSSFSINYIPMAPSTAWFFIVLCLCIFIIQCRFFKKAVKMITVWILLFIALFSAFLIANFFFRFNFDIEDLFLKNPDTFHMVLLGRMSPITALLFLLISVNTVIYCYRKPEFSQNAFGIVSFLIFFYSLVLVIGYLYNAPFLYSMSVIPVAFSTSIAFLFLGIKLLIMSEFRFWPIYILPDTHVTKLLLRGFLPTVLLLLFFYGFIDSVSLISYDPLLESIFLIVSLLITSVIIYIISRKIGNIINTQEDELRKKNEEITTQNEEYQSLNEELNESNYSIRKINEELQSAKEKAEESEKLKSVFLANMSHEIRTPMNAIKGFSEMLLNKNLSVEKQILFSQIINQRSEDLLRIINDILDISKIEAGQMKIINSIDNINTLLDELYEFFNNRNLFVEKKNIKLIVKKRLPDSQAYVNSDFLRLKQVFINLINNSYKFTEKGTIEYGYTIEKDNFLKFYVKDTGMGITRNKQQIIFDRFRQADEDYLSNKFGGIGLGLSISKGIISLMKGNIWLESEQAAGTTFYFTIPFDFSASVKKEEVSEKIFADWQGRKILTVEDDKYNATFISEILTENKAVCLFAGTGKEALELYLNEKDIHLILMDIKLPDIDGLNLTKKILQLNPAAKIIAQTAYALEEDKENCLNAGCIDFISKPLDRVLFVNIINKHLS